MPKGTRVLGMSLYSPPSTSTPTMPGASQDTTAASQRRTIHCCEAASAWRPTYMATASSTGTSVTADQYSSTRRHNDRLAGASKMRLRLRSIVLSSVRAVQTSSATPMGPNAPEGELILHLIDDALERVGQVDQPGLLADLSLLAGDVLGGGDGAGGGHVHGRAQHHRAQGGQGVRADGRRGGRLAGRRGAGRLRAGRLGGGRRLGSAQPRAGRARLPA